MKTVSRILICLFAFGVPAALRAAADRAPDDPAAAFLERSFAEVLRVIYDQPKGDAPLSSRLLPVVERTFDVEYTTRSAIGPAWNKFTDDQKARAVALFSRMALRTYVDRFEPSERPKVTFGSPVKPAENRREIPSKIGYGGQEYNVTYRLRRTHDGWRLYDIVAENISMVATFRAQFEEILTKGGPPALLKAMEDNLNQTPQKS